MAARFVDGNEEDIVQPKLRPTSSNSRQKDEEDISELRAIFYTRNQKNLASLFHRAEKGKW